MTDITLKIKLLSDTLIGSGQGWGSQIDNDIVFDDVGLPCIPARRIKGCLRESAVEVMDMFDYSDIDKTLEKKIDILFGKTGESHSGLLSISNCYLEQYPENKTYLEWLIETYPDLLSKETIIESLSSTRQNTAIENGIAKEHSLRTSRVIKKDKSFYGNIKIGGNISSDELDLLVFSAINLRYIGTNRNRGLGLIQCEILDNNKKSLDKNSIERLENKVKGSK